MFLAFLNDPNQRQIGLKETAQRLLGIAPEERDALADWLLKYQPVPGVRVSKSPKGKHPPGKYIAYAPTDVVGPYAIGDVDRTGALFDHLWPKIEAAGMLDAYDRERRLLLCLLDMERRGVAVDLARLEDDITKYHDILTRLSQWLIDRLDADPNTNLDSGPQLIDALQRAGEVDIAKLGITKTGKPASDKASIDEAVNDKQLSAALRYRSQLSTCLHTFMEPWRETAHASGGRIYTTWHQTRGGGGGARTGRLSSTPNFQNIPVEFKPLFGPAPLPSSPISDLLPLPLCRTYITAYAGHTLAGRDFSSQELRILAHFEDGKMLQSYKDNPGIDFHDHAAKLVTATTGVAITRRVAKDLSFSILYGAGPAKLSTSLGCTVVEAKQLIKAYHAAFPDLRKFQDQLTYRARMKQPVRTIGGRLYYCEPPMVIEGRMVNFEYKMTNTIVQSSAADHTKMAMVEAFDTLGPGKLILSVHDEIVMSVPEDTFDYDMERLRDAMNAPVIDTPVLSKGERGDNWAGMQTSEI
jgi:DNA polymerase I-like protein with 3'-5' exonuclease and polymerase domains